MKYALMIFTVLMVISCKDPKVAEAERKASEAKEKLEFSQQILNNGNITALIAKAGMQKGMDTVYAILDTNVVEAKKYYDNLYDRAMAKMSK